MIQGFKASQDYIMVKALKGLLPPTDTAWVFDS